MTTQRDLDMADSTERSSQHSGTKGPVFPHQPHPYLLSSLATRAHFSPFGGHLVSEEVHLRLILVSGKTQDFTFSPNDSATDIAKHVFDNWPAGWEEERVSSPSILRLIFQGRFLHGNVTLGALKLPPGRTTVMHLVARETLPEPNSHGQRNREKTTESNCCLLL
ncbi:hypothetical protein FQN60_010160 [Etheostoma spectabile]|uniref:Ubiquitin-like protein 3 n=1 Tax=Etheostoma spectabile TaxID=54343 RepID=A0A5J5D8B2_9PERO|nr:hypothetical protein FQN60_010160 [Etheostoma spectabile]